LLTDSGLLFLVLPSAQVDAERVRLIGNLVELSMLYAQRADLQASAVKHAELRHLLVEFHDVLEADLLPDLASGQTNVPVIRLAALYHDAEAAIADFGAVRFSRDELQYARALVHYRSRFDVLLSPSEPLAIHRFFRDTGAGRGRMGLIVLALAQHLGTADESTTLAIARALLHNYVNAHDVVVAPRPLLNGAALAERFQLRGPDIGQALQVLIEAQVRGEVQTVVDAERFVAVRLDSTRAD
jgi:hypothetical protein